MNDRRDSSQDFSLERQGGMGRGPWTNKSGDQAEAKSISADRSSFAIADENTLPDHISRKYYVIENETRKDRHNRETRLFADERGEYLAFKITEDRLVTRLAAAEVIRDMVSVAQHRQWEALHVRGSAEFRREAWLEGVPAESKCRGISRLISIGRHWLIDKPSGTDHVLARIRRRFVQLLTGTSPRQESTTTKAFRDV